MWQLHAYFAQTPVLLDAVFAFQFFLGGNWRHSSNSFLRFSFGSTFGCVQQRRELANPFWLRQPREKFQAKLPRICDFNHIEPRADDHFNFWNKCNVFFREANAIQNCRSTIFSSRIGCTPTPHPTPTPIMIPTPWTNPYSIEYFESHHQLSQLYQPFASTELCRTLCNQRLLVRIPLVVRQRWRSGMLSLIFFPREQQWRFLGWLYKWCAALRDGFLLFDWNDYKCGLRRHLAKFTIH